MQAQTHMHVHRYKQIHTHTLSLSLSLSSRADTLCKSKRRGRRVGLGGDRGKKRFKCSDASRLSSTIAIDC